MYWGLFESKARSECSRSEVLFHADVNSHDYDGRSALHLAASEGKLGAVQLLLERGANVNPLDRWGGTVSSG